MAHFYIHLPKLTSSRPVFSVGLLGWFGIRVDQHQGLTCYVKAGTGFLAYGIPADYDEVVVWEAGPLVLTRAETDEERMWREEGEAEQAYQDWCADFYSY